MGCVITIFKNSQELEPDGRQYVSFKDENEIYEYTPSNPLKSTITTNNNADKDDQTNKVNISSISSDINVTELLSLHNSFQLNPDNTIIYDEEDVDMIKSLQNELDLDNHSSSLNVSFTFMQ